MKDKPQQESLANYLATFEKPQQPLLDWSLDWSGFDKILSRLTHMEEKYRKDFRKEKQKHQQEPQELRKEKPQQEKPQQEPQELKEAEPKAPELPAEADLAAGAPPGTFQKGAWIPADPPEPGFAGQGQSVQ